MTRPARTTMSPEQAGERFPELVAEHLDWLCEVAESATVIEGDVRSDVSCLLDLAAEVAEEGTIIVVDGDLTLTAPCARWGDDAAANGFLVTGDLHCEGLYLSEVGVLIVKGSVQAKALVGCYGDNGGSMDIHGDLDADLLVARTYFCFGIQGELRAKQIVSDSTYASDVASSFVDSGDLEAFVPEVIDGDRADNQRLLERVVAGLPVLRQS